MIKKEDLEKEVESLSEEILKNGYSKGYNPDDILCRMCGYKSCLYKNEGRNIIKEALKKKDSK